MKSPTTMRARGRRLADALAFSLALALTAAPALAAGAPSGPPKAAPTPPDPHAVPKLGKLNQHVLRVLRSYPTNGTHRYSWPKDGSYGGVTEDLVYDGQVVARGDGKGSTYCCGLTFEVFFKAWRRWAKRRRKTFTVGGLSARELKRLRGDWYCSGGVRDGPVSALVRRGLGVRIERLSDARAGDFCQLWRASGSGHSVIFLEWIRDRRGEIVAMRYWSSQPATRGIGVRVERLVGKNRLLREKLYLARAGRKR